MSILDWFKPNREPPKDEKTLEDVFNENDVILFEDTFAVVTPKDKPNTKERGTSLPGAGKSDGFINFREYNTELQGVAGLQKVDKMRRSDTTVRSSTRAIKTPILAGRWFVDPAADTDKDKEVAEFVWKCFNDFMSTTFPQIILEALLCVDYGFYVMEPVYKEIKYKGERRIVWKKLASRHPLDYIRWEYDEHGGPKAFITRDKDLDELSLSMDDILAFVFDKEAGGMEGLSLLRTAYQNWYYKTQLYKIDAIQKERHGIGIPVIKLPVGFDSGDVAEAQEIGANLRTNERAHVVLPPNWELIFAKLEGQPVDAMKSIEHHNDMIRENVMAAFMSPSSTTNEEDQSIFLKSTRFIADMICGVFNVYAIPKLVSYNFEVEDFPKLKVRRIGEQADWRVQSFAIRNYIGAGVIRPDDVLEAHIRNEMDLPLADVETARITETPQNPNDETPAENTPKVDVVTDPVGKDLPRQAPMPDFKINNKSNGDSSGTSGIT